MKSGNVLHGRSNLFKNKGDLIWVIKQS
jgi:hypothetical protein